MGRKGEVTFRKYITIFIRNSVTKIYYDYGYKGQILTSKYLDYYAKNTNAPLREILGCDLYLYYPYSDKNLLPLEVKESIGDCMNCEHFSLTESHIYNSKYRLNCGKNIYDCDMSNVCDNLFFYKCRCLVASLFEKHIDYYINNVMDKKILKKLFKLYENRDYDSCKYILLYRKMKKAVITDLLKGKYKLVNKIKHC